MPKGTAGQGRAAGLVLTVWSVKSFRQAEYPPAPLDPAELEQSLRPFGESRMLPRAAYVDPAVFGWEQQHFFGGGWICVARSDQLPEPGDQRAEATGQGGVLLVRGEDGALRAFANTLPAPGA